MKRFLIVLLTLALSLSLCVFAEPETQVTEVIETEADEIEQPAGEEQEADLTLPSENALTDDEQAGESYIEEGFNNDSVVDNANVLSEDEKEALREIFGRIRNEYHVDAALYTAGEMDQDAPWYEAQSIYYQNAYGYGSGNDGILFFNCPVERKYAIFTYGSCEKLFNDAVLDDVEDSVLYYLRNEYFFDSYKTFADKCAYYISDPSRSEEALETMEEEAAAERNKDRNSGLITVGIFALVIAFIMMRSKVRKMNTAVKSDYASNYMKPGSLNLTNSQDLFLYSHTSRVRIQTESRSSGGSSSGGSGGGGGRGGSY